MIKEKLGNIVSFQRGYDLTHGQMSGGSVPVVGSSEVIGWHNVAKSEAPTLLIGRSGTVGRPQYYDCAVWPHNTTLFVTNFHGNNPKYCYYLLQNLNLEDYANSSGVPTLNRNFIEPLQVKYHEKDEQDRIIKISEKFMREIYDYWFVQFDFPDENGHPYKSSGGEMAYDEKLKREIPKGWRTLELGDIIKEAKKSSVQVNGARERAGAYPFFTSGDEILDFDEYYVDGFNIFLNTGGNADIKSYYGKSAYSTDTWCISADEYSYMLFIFLDSIKQQINNNCFAGSGLKHLQKNAFKKIKIIAPEDNLLRTFNDLAQSSYLAISSHKAENKKLASLRDWLLPMLMNGQVKVKDK